MSWEGDLREQVLEAFRDAQRRRGEFDTSDERADVSLSAPSIVVGRSDASTRPRRVVGVGASIRRTE